MTILAANLQLSARSLAQASLAQASQASQVSSVVWLTMLPPLVHCIGPRSAYPKNPRYAHWLFGHNASGSEKGAQNAAFFSKDWPEPPACTSIPWQSALVSGALGTTRRAQQAMSTLYAAAYSALQDRLCVNTVCCKSPSADGLYCALYISWTLHMHCNILLQCQHSTCLVQARPFSSVYAVQRRTQTNAKFYTVVRTPR